VDIHNHLHDPNLFPDGIDFASQTASAAAGGVTTVVELPTQSLITSPDAFRKKRDECVELAHIDFGLVAGNVEEADIDVEGIMAEGTRDFKTFTAEPYLASDETIVSLMESVGNVDGKVRVHCETQGILDHARASIDETAPDVYMESRPLEAELDAINRMGWFAEYAECPLHVVHVSAGQGARRRTVQITVERSGDPRDLSALPRVFGGRRRGEGTVPEGQSEPQIARGGRSTLGLRPRRNDRSHRQRTLPDIPGRPRARLGEHLGAVRRTAQHRNDARVPRQCRRSRGPTLLDTPSRTRLFAASTRGRDLSAEGSIQEGTDADIVIIREDQFTVSADDLQYVGGWTPYEGREWSARVDTVIANGDVIASDHEVRSSPGRGEFLPRP